MTSRPSALPAILAFCLPLAAPLALALPLAAPAAAQSMHSWPLSSVSVTQRPGNGCQPGIVSISAFPGAQRVEVRLNNPVAGSITATLELNIRQGGQVLAYRGSDNLPRGTGAIQPAGPVVPANLAGSTVELSVTYCMVYPPAPPPPVTR
ncbi:hypothetical protein [Sediminicoccus sp. KRV36]|uniref:hypothetical protein n=1 Tax=Sediminicoccus sp. KRV36 TaxID=3133721 RepID=UPI00200E3CD0|nr:hypothetical protein [Sediminicoccus rosea]UPY38010.1 hypothetical protein LHU95_04735 [Sediminicoccus rosea]